MTVDREGTTQAVLAKLLEEHGLGAETRLYREVTADALVATDTPGVFRLSANSSPSESVVDVYGQGYLVQAEQVGPGLAFAETPRPGTLGQKRHRGHTRTVNCHGLTRTVRRPYSSTVDKSKEN